MGHHIVGVQNSAAHTSSLQDIIHETGGIRHRQLDGCPQVFGSAKTVLGARHTFTTAAYMLGGGRNEITGVRRLGWSMICALAVSLLAYRRDAFILTL